MRAVQIVIFSLLGFVLSVRSLPVQPEGREGIEIIPLEEQFGGAPIIDTAVVGGTLYNPFDGLLDSLTGVMARMRQQMESLFGRLPTFNGTGVNAPFPPVFPQIPEIDLSKGNTTSVVKEIDGHKVIINETTYAQNGDNGGSFFKIRTIDVIPDNTDLTTEKNSESITPKDVEPLEDSIENEIPKNTEDFSNLETFDEVDSSIPSHSFPQKSWESIEPLENLKDNSVEFGDLRGDTYINDFMADAGAPTNPEAELFSPIMKFGGQPPPMFEKLDIEIRK